ncbi:MAG: B12-binding domain-containing radical SAM protein [bacterium]|nr:MAG: B12-binding domain-containing radical SAM protein [bacterium]
MSSRPCARRGCPVRVLLIQPPHIGEKVVRPPSFLPLNLGYLASAMRGAGMEVAVLDIWGRHLSSAEVRRFLNSETFDVYGVSALSTQFDYVEKMISLMREITSKPVVLGGALATFSYDAVFATMDVNVCVLGEGEDTALELFPAVASGEDLSRIRGIAYRREDEVVVTGPPEPIRDLDSIPLPAYDLFDVTAYAAKCSVYSKYGTWNHLPALNVLSGRGCPFDCHFCSKTISGTRYRSVEAVVDEIRFLVRKYGIRAVFFNDELLVASRKRVLELCEKIGPLKLKWSCQGRANLMDRSLVRAMKAAGCVSVGYGIESGSQALLEAMNKRQTLEDVVRAVNVTVAEGVEPIPQWMFGYPGENEETVRETRSTFSRLDFPVNPAFICTPLPGTRLYEDALREGRITDRVDFHRKLSDGYASRRSVLVNYTPWSADELYRRKRALEVQVRLGFYGRALMKPRLYGVLVKEIRMSLAHRFNQFKQWVFALPGRRPAAAVSDN